MINWQHFLNRAGKLTIAIVAISLIVSLLTWWGQNQSTTYWVAFDWELISQGQWWRLISPIFLHFMIAGLPIHLLFNMMWFWELGGSIEKAKGANYLLVLVLVIALVSNLSQYFYYVYSVGELQASRYLFGGMSGVVYGLLGFIFVRRRFDPFFPLRINDAILNFMLIWLVLGFLGIIGGMANVAHLSGLLMGAAFGFISAKTKKF